MLRFRHYKPNKFSTPYWGWSFTPAVQPTLDIYFGKHTFVIFWSNLR